LPERDAIAVLYAPENRLEDLLQLPAGSRPTALVPAFGAGRLYVLNYGSGTLATVDVWEQRVLSSSVPVGTPPLWGLPARIDEEVYLVSEASDQVAIVEPDGSRAVARVAVGRRPVRCVFYRNRGQLYTTNLDDDSVSIVEVASRQVLATVPVGIAPFRMVTCFEKSGEDEVWVLNRGSEASPQGQISVIDGATHKVKHAIRVVDRPVGWLLRGNHAHVVSAAARSMSIVDLHRKRAVASVGLPAPPEPHAFGSNMVFTRRGFLAISNADASVTLLRRPLAR
jgi:YVTN family beta-propeller protein